ncbi:MAG: molybdopterin-guanine dinucleotide biosynthesis protein B, partial [Methanosarcinales archaeon]|nr:molybdopterin-guanine dinucleotide biosynthesis protein B [Methanosarcinales archaeon]
MKIIAIIGHKNSGKTSLVLDIINKLKQRGRVGTIKHMADHAIDSDGTDTASHFAAGADTTIGIGSDGMLVRTDDAGMGYAIDLLAGQGMDYAVVEGAKESGLAKIVIGDVDAKNIVCRTPEISTVSDADYDSSSCMEKIIDIIESQPHYHTLNSFMAQVRRNPDI